MFERLIELTREAICIKTNDLIDTIESIYILTIQYFIVLVIFGIALLSLCGILSLLEKIFS